MSSAPPPDFPHSQSYGTDAWGTICAYRFSASGVGEALGGAEEGLQWLQEVRQRPADGADGFVWLHMNLSHARCESWLRDSLQLGQHFFDAQRDASRSTRIEKDGENLFAVFNDVAFDFSWDASDVATLWLSVQPGLVVSARRQPLRSVDRLRMAVRRGDELRSPVGLLNHLLADQADELQRIVRLAAERVDDIEDEALAGRTHRQRGELAGLRRLLVRLQRLLAPEPSALQRTLSSPPAWVDQADRQRLHHASEEFALVLRDIVALQERTKLIQDEASAKVAEENNRSLFILTVVTVLALPINLISGLFGMNVGGIPLADATHGFWWVVGGIATITSLISLAVIIQMRRSA